jgi:hypothetical protein
MMKSFKLVVYAPLTHADKVREAMAEAGGGRLGLYDGCSFSVRGTGRYIPQAGAEPHIGQVGRLSEIDEERIEITVEEQYLEGVIQAIRSAHPYQEVPIDVYVLYNAKGTKG